MERWVEVNITGETHSRRVENGYGGYGIRISEKKKHRGHAAFQRCPDEGSLHFPAKRKRKKHIHTFIHSANIPNKSRKNLFTYSTRCLTACLDWTWTWTWTWTTRYTLTCETHTYIHTYLTYHPNDAPPFPFPFPFSFTHYRVRAFRHQPASERCSDLMALWLLY